MKIALFTETYYPHINGVVTHVKLLKTGLEQLGHTVLIVTADHNTSRHFIKDGILHCPAHTSKKFYGYGLSKPVSRHRLKLLEKFSPQIIHIHNEFGIGLSGILYAKILKVPLVYTLHTMYDDYLYYIAPKSLVTASKPIIYKYMGFIANRANQVTGPSPKCQHFLNKANTSLNVNVIPNAVELDNFTPEQLTTHQKNAILKQHNIPANSTIACFVGRLGSEKSVDVILDFWAEQITKKDNIIFIIIGDGPVKQQLINQANRLNIGSIVYFLGKIPHENLAPYYCLADVYITASLSDTNSISMLEAMSCGLPVLQRTDPLNTGQVVDGSNGFNFNTADQLASHLRNIQKMDKQQLATLKKSVVSSIQNQNSKQLAEKTLNVYYTATTQTDHTSQNLLAKIFNK